MDAGMIGAIIGLAFRTFIFPFLIGKGLMKFFKVKPMIAIFLQYPLYAALAWPFMLFVTMGTEEALGNIILDIPFLLIWMLISVLTQRRKGKKNDLLTRGILREGSHREKG